MVPGKGWCVIIPAHPFFPFGTWIMFMETPLRILTWGVTLGNLMFIQQKDAFLTCKMLQNILGIMGSFQGFFKKINPCWSIVALQCCVSSYCTADHFFFFWTVFWISSFTIGRLRLTISWSNACTFYFLKEIFNPDIFNWLYRMAFYIIFCYNHNYRSIWCFITLVPHSLYLYPAFP